MTIRAYVAECLALAGVEAAVRICGAEGEPLIACEAVFFQRGNARYLGLEYVPNIIYFANGSLDYIFKNYSLDPDVSPRPITVTLPDRSYVYDMRAGKYLGHTATFKTAIKPGQGHVFALLPYKVKSLELSCQGCATKRDDANDGTSAADRPRFQAAVRTRASHPELHCFRVDVFDPEGREVREYGQNVLARGGKATFTIPFALSDAPGEWRVRLTDVASGISAVETLEFGRINAKIPALSWDIR